MGTAHPTIEGGVDPDGPLIGCEHLSPIVDEVKDEGLQILKSYMDGYLTHFWR